MEIGTSQDKNHLESRWKLRYLEINNQKVKFQQKNLDKRDSRRLLQVVSGRTPAWRPA